MDRPPDFFMSTAGEYRPLAAPRACWRISRLKDMVRDDHMLVGIEPVLDGQRFGLGAIDVDRLIISTRVEGQTLFPISQWPAPVYVARILDDTVLSSKEFTRQQVELIAWGMLFRTPDEALDHERRSRQ
jgi:hypothetical protein